MSESAMIIPRKGRTPLLLTQPHHSQLVATIMERWQGDGFPDRPTGRVLLAIREHCNGGEVDAGPICTPLG